MTYLLFVISVVLAFFLVVISIPAIVKIAKKKHLFEEINERKVHKQIVPALGGVAIFIGFIISSIISSNGFSFDELKYIIASIILVAFIGLKDDLITVSNRKKFLIQVFAALLLIFLAKMRIVHFHGFLGLYKVNYIISVLATLFVMILIINAYNLIDGIDGLASGLGIVGSFTFGVVFAWAGEISFAIMSFALTGSLIGFFIFNVFGKKNKIFMGDTGSLIIGLTMSALVVQFNEIDSSASLPLIFQKVPALTMAIVIVPIIDTLRVFAIRIYHGKSPFAPDMNHVHHRLLRLYGNHIKVTITILLANVFFVIFALVLIYYSVNINLQFALIIIIALIVSYIPVFILKKKKKQIQLSL